MGELSQVVSSEVREHLARLKLTQADAAQAIGVSTRTVIDLLGNRREWRVSEIDKIAEWLEVDARELLFPKKQSR